MKQPVQGKIYAVSDRHEEISIQCEVNDCHILIQPESWDSLLMHQLLERDVVVYAKGMEANGLPLLLRAKVQYLEWE